MISADVKSNVKQQEIKDLVGQVKLAKLALRNGPA